MFSMSFNLIVYTVFALTFAFGLFGVALIFTNASKRKQAQNVDEAFTH